MSMPAVCAITVTVFKKISLSLQKKKKKKVSVHEGSIYKMKGQPTEREKKFANDMADEGLIFKIYKQLMQLNI